MVKSYAWVIVHGPVKFLPRFCLEWCIPRTSSECKKQIIPIFVRLICRIPDRSASVWRSLLLSSLLLSHKGFGKVLLHFGKDWLKSRLVPIPNSWMGISLLSLSPTANSQDNRVMSDKCGFQRMATMCTTQYPSGNQLQTHPREVERC